MSDLGALRDPREPDEATIRQYLTDPVMAAVTKLLAQWIATAVVDAPVDDRLTEFERVARAVTDALIASGVPTLVAATIDARDAIPEDCRHLHRSLWKVAPRLGLIPRFRP